MIKKILLALILITILFLEACNATTTTKRTIITISKTTTTIDDSKVALPDLTGMNREKIKETLNALSLEVVFAFDSSRYYGNGEYDKFIRYQNKKAGDMVYKDSSIKVFTSQLELPTFNCEELLPWNRDLEGKSFMNDSYGYVTWKDGTYADGDTTTFTDIITGEQFKVRFLCVNTKEVSHSANDPGDPWGIAAGDYIKERLRNANKIWVESESETSRAQDVYFRNLGYVWVDGSCLNLELIALAYSGYLGNDRSSKYHEVMSAVEEKVRVTGRRYYGEYDPNFDYSKLN